jgi:4a-hydroxytetrahydrobiopterin dehydratase
MVDKELSQEKCSACTGDAPPVTEEELQQLKPQVPQWQIKDENGEPRLERQFKFSDFKQALDFTCRVGEEAEAEGHHPTLKTEWGKVTVTWWTHAINGLHRNDFVMAAKTDQIASQVIAA